MDARPVTLVVIAKTPAPGRVKTRLCPPCTSEQAASIAAAALADTLEVVCATPAARRVLVLDGEPGRWIPAGVEVIAQRGDGLDERLAAAFEDVGGPALLVGMDTPQITVALLSAAVWRLGRDERVVLGHASDGGWWAIGLHRSDPEVFLGVPMSTSRTGRHQERRLRRRGYELDLLPVLRDVDTFADAREVVRDAPNGRFARAMAAVTGDRVVGRKATPHPTPVAPRDPTQSPTANDTAKDTANDCPAPAAGAAGASAGSGHSDDRDAVGGR